MQTERQTHSSQPSTERPDAAVIVIGAGPAGLAVGHQLKKRGIDPLIIEKGPGVAHSFQQMYKSIFFGPWLNNMLFGSLVPVQDWLKRTHRNDWIAYLLRYAEEHDLRIRTSTGVQRVTREDGLFKVHTDQGVLTAPVVINATGYFSKPWIPDYPGRDTTRIPQIHAHDYIEPATVRDRIGADRGRVLIVGKRISAGELMVEIHHGGYQVSLSCRSKLRFGSSYLQQALFGPVVMLFEQFGSWFHIKLPDTNPRMVGGESQRLVRQGLVDVYPDVRELKESSVVFADGREASFDLIIWATGYRAAVDHLLEMIHLEDGRPALDGLQARGVPGLYFLGLDNLRSFRSRYLRGIREDAVAVAEQVAAAKLTAAL